ncbi:sulfatase-like hydrolase/transferase [Photobacterium sagamiensis]|uniref:sulfatase-like hydrolase/transferase n=1 Tax=Photobacterium sagamiensis TaxID=2910241 RepID=UPI003D13FE81
MLKRTIASCAITAALASSASLAGTSASALPVQEGANRTPTDQPNVVLIMLDDAGYADISANDGKYSTPNIDKLAAQGQNFTDFYMTAPVSSPARAAMLTSRVGLRTGMYGDINPVFMDENGKGGMPTEEVTIPEMLVESGYKTFAVGKWHLGTGKDNIEHAATRHGFQEWFGIPMSNDNYNTNPEFSIPNVQRVANEYGLTSEKTMELFMRRDQVQARDSDGRSDNKHFASPLVHSWVNEDGSISDNVVGTMNQNTFARQMTSRVVEYINSNADKPFFAYVAFPETHVPLFTSPEFTGVTDTAYGDVMTEMDYSIGRITRALELNGLDDNTIVIFTSDNGPWLSYSDRGAAGSAKPFKEGKSSPYEGGSRVPGVIKWSGQIKPGMNNSMFSAVDIMPTLATMTGAKMPDVVTDGLDQSDNILNGEESPRNMIPIFMRGRLVGFREGDYKLVFGGIGLIGKVKVKKPKMFNVAKDVAERKNLAKKEPEKYAEMRAKAKAYLDSIEVNPVAQFDL